MTKNGMISHFVTPAKAGCQASQGFFDGLSGLSLPGMGVALAATIVDEETQTAQNNPCGLR